MTAAGKKSNVCVVVSDLAATGARVPSEFSEANNCKDPLLDISTDGFPLRLHTEAGDALLVKVAGR